MTDKSRHLLLRRIGESGLTNDELAKKSGVHRGTINNMTNGKTTNPKCGTIMKLAIALKLSPEDMFKIFLPGLIEEENNLAY